MTKHEYGKQRGIFTDPRIREGREYAYEIAFLKYYSPLWKYVRSEELSKEIVQEVFTEVWEGRKNLKPIRPLADPLMWIIGFEHAYKLLSTFITHIKTQGYKQ